MAEEDTARTGCRGVGLASVDLQATIERSLTLALSEIETSGWF